MSINIELFDLPEITDGKFSTVCWADSDGHIRGRIESYNMLDFKFQDVRDDTETDKTVDETIQHIANMYLHKSDYKDCRIWPGYYNKMTGTYSYACVRDIYNDLGHIVTITIGDTDIEALQLSNMLLDNIVSIAARNK